MRADGTLMPNSLTYFSLMNNDLVMIEGSPNRAAATFIVGTQKTQYRRTRLSDERRRQHGHGDLYPDRPLSYFARSNAEKKGFGPSFLLAGVKRN